VTHVAKDAVENAVPDRQRLEAVVVPVLDMVLAGFSLFMLRWLPGVRQRDIPTLTEDIYRLAA
jgi:hypothetical protein